MTFDLKLVVWGLLLLALVSVTGCAQPLPPAVPTIELTCPDPAARQRLDQGSTYRDLARSRSEAISGWRQCSDALEASNDLHSTH